MNKMAVFIDRDGTINEEVGYVDNFYKFRILPMVAGGIRKLNHHNIPAILITNQSGVGRGYFSKGFLDELHKKMAKELDRNGCRLDGIYICPHHPNESCACRKPKPGMLLRAARENGITLYRSYIIGDKLIDIKLAHSVGAKGILVLTGYGAEELISKGGIDDSPDHVAANLYEAVNWILGQVAAPTSNRRILIVKPSSLGDIVHCLPTLWELRRLYPDAYIGWLVKEAWKDILAGNPLLDKVIALKKGMNGFMSAIREIREAKFDMVIDLQGLFRSGIMTFLSGARERIGFSNAREFAHLYYTRKVVLPHGYIHAVDRYLLTLNPPSPPFTKGGPGGLHFPLYTEIEDSEWAIDFLRKNGVYNTRPLIAVNPSARWVKKRWPASSYAALINQLIKDLKAGIIILGSKEDIPVTEDISSRVYERVAMAAGVTSLKALTALLGRIDLLITNDSGPMHIAAALGRPVVALFGPTDPGLTGPYGEGHTVIRKGLDCSPCHRRPCVHGRPLCMEAITVEEVADAVGKKLTVSSK